MRLLFFIITLTVLVSCSNEGTSNKESDKLCDCKEMIENFSTEGQKLMRPELTDEENQEIFHQHYLKHKSEFDDCVKLVNKSFNHPLELIKYLKEENIDCP